METKPGYKTTEFWLSLAAILIGAVMASGMLDGLGTDHWAVKAIGIAASVLGALGYSASRALTKSGEARAAAITAATSVQPKDPQ